MSTEQFAVKSKGPSEPTVGEDRVFVVSGFSRRMGDAGGRKVRSGFAASFRLRSEGAHTILSVDLSYLGIRPNQETSRCSD
jgi:hypothetical protein